MALALHAIKWNSNSAADQEKEKVYICLEFYSSPYSEIDI